MRNATPVVFPLHRAAGGSPQPDLTSRNLVTSEAGQMDMADCDAALIRALDRASAASQWDIVRQLADELHARRLARTEDLADASRTCRIKKTVPMTDGELLFADNDQPRE